MSQPAIEWTASGLVDRLSSPHRRSAVGEAICGIVSRNRDGTGTAREMGRSVAVCDADSRAQHFRTST